MTQCAKIMVGLMANVGNVFYPTFTNVFFNFHLNVYYIYAEQNLPCKLYVGCIVDGHAIHGVAAAADDDDFGSASVSQTFICITELVTDITIRCLLSVMLSLYSKCNETAVC